MTKKPVEPNDPRLGTPPDKLGMHATPLQTADRRQAVMIMLFPPEQLRDAPYADVLGFVFGHGTSILHSIAQEIHQSYTSEPLDLAPTQNVIKALQEHVDAQQRGKQP
jgi:hypothetical protein